MARESMRVWLAKGNRHKILTYITAIFFIILVTEKITECVSAEFWQGVSGFNLQMSFGDLFGILIYSAMTILIIAKADYKYLLIPDGLLFLSKFIHVIEGFDHLFPLTESDILTKITAIEEIVDNFLFMVFLIIFFSGKLFRNLAGYIKFLIPYVCVISLVMIFPTTVVIETIKVLIEAEFYSYPISVMTFNFIKAVSKEIFLDIPYFLLVLMVYYKPKKH